VPGYRVEIDDARAHGFRVTSTLPRPAAEQVLSLPVWIPGSYRVREFARHLSHLSARQGRREVALVQGDKASWVAACSGNAALVVSYRVHAFDASVRGAFLDTERGFFNGSSLSLRADGRRAEPHRVQIGRSPAGRQVATAMPPHASNAAAAPGVSLAVIEEADAATQALRRSWLGR
jgi:predicted metalloprotease with PDZ domain